MKTTEPSRRASEQSSRLLLFRAVLGLMIAAANAPAATLLEEYVPLHVGDHYTELVEGRTNTILVQAGVAAFPGSVTEVTIIPVDGTKQTNFEYAGYSGNDVVNYGQDVGTNFALVFAPPLVTMSESALSSLGARFSGSTSWTNAVPGEPAIFTVESETISGMVNSTGTVSVAAGTFPNCLAVVQTVTTITSESILGMNYSSTNTTKQTLFFRPQCGLRQRYRERHELPGADRRGHWRSYHRRRRGANSPHAVLRSWETPAGLVRPGIVRHVRTDLLDANLDRSDRLDYRLD